MPSITQRLSRLHNDHSYYYVVLRGNRREPLFSTAEDRRVLNAVATRTLKRCAATLHAYCLLPNHFQVLVQIEDRRLTKAIRQIVAGYSRYKQRHATTGDELFHRPFKAQRIETHGEFLKLLRTIHLSPTTLNNMGELADYRWSSHRAYLGYKSVARINTDLGLSLFRSEDTPARTTYYHFITEAMSAQVDETTAQERPCQDLPQASNASDSVALEKPSGPVLSSLIESDRPLPQPKKRPILRLRRTQKNSTSRRFLSIY